MKNKTALALLRCIGDEVDCIGLEPGETQVDS